jgi:hypothetical protein
MQGGDVKHRKASAHDVWQHAIRHQQMRDQGQGGVTYDRYVGSNLSREEQSALLIGRKWRARATKKLGLSRTFLVERIQLEDSVCR